MSSNSDSDSFADFNSSESSEILQSCLLLAVFFRQRMNLSNMLKIGTLKLVIPLSFYVQLKIETQARRIEYISDVIEAANQSLAMKPQD
jgi:hypothetical protein